MLCNQTTTYPRSDVKASGDVRPLKRCSKINKLKPIAVSTAVKEIMNKTKINPTGLQIAEDIKIK